LACAINLKITRISKIARIGKCIIYPKNEKCPLSHPGYLGNPCYFFQHNLPEELVSCPSDFLSFLSRKKIWL